MSCFLEECALQCLMIVSWDSATLKVDSCRRQKSGHLERDLDYFVYFMPLINLINFEEYSAESQFYVILDFLF